MNKLEQLRTMTEVVADTGDLEAIANLRPVDATTNPSLLLKAAGLPRFSETLQTIRRSGLSAEDACDQFAVNVGKEITQLVPGWVSTEVDARLSFDTTATIKKARQLIALYDREGVSAQRVLIKIAATWEGIRAAEALEREGINCNLTLLFGFDQAVACADAGVTLISPFVGRIFDWYVAHDNLVVSDPDNDPGVQSVRRIYDHYKRHGYRTIVMGASFRNTGQIEALAGCDRLTISPDLLNELAAAEGELPRRLTAEAAGASESPAALTESAFRWQLNNDAMATEKLADGIRRFAEDQVKLEAVLAE